MPELVASRADKSSPCTRSSGVRKNLNVFLEKLLRKAKSNKRASTDQNYRLYPTLSSFPLNAGPGKPVDTGSTSDTDTPRYEQLLLTPIVVLYSNYGWC